MNRTRRLIQVIMAIALIVTIVLVVQGLKKREPDPMPPDFTADGMGMQQTIFDNENHPIIELRSASSRRGEKDRIHMNRIRFRVLSQGEISDDIRVEGEEGYVENNYHNFRVRRNARIYSERFSLKAEEFFLKDRAVLRSEKPVTFSLHDLEGTAAAGMTYLMKHNMIKLFNVKGIHLRQGKKYRFQADTLWFSKKERKLILEKRAAIQGPDSLLSGAWISLVFDEKIKRVQQTRCQGKAHLHMENGTDPAVMRDIRCDILTGEHDENGDLKSLNLVHQVIVHLLQQERHTRIRSELIEIEFTPGGDSLKQVRIPFSADVHHANGTEFSATAGRMDFAFRDGELAQWSGNGNAELRGKDFSCRGDTIEFDAPRSLIRVKAEQSRVIRDKDVFHAPIFSMHSEKKWLRGEKGVRATFHPRNAQPPFSENPFFIRSEKMLLMDENDTTQFSGNVQLIQDNTRLSAETLNMQAGKSLTASKNVKLAFQSQDEQLSAWGDTLIFDPGKKTLVIKGKGGMQSAETRLNAEALILSFLDDRKLGTISAEGAIRFEKGDISGGSERVWWDFLRRSMRFSGKAVLEKKGGGKAEGESLEMDLETDNIRIQSRGDQRTSTVLEQ